MFSVKKVNSAEYVIIYSADCGIFAIFAAKLGDYECCHWKKTRVRRVKSALSE